MSTATTARYRVDSDLLTQRQAEVLGWLAEGKTLVQVAAVIRVTTVSAQAYGMAMKERLGAATQAEAVAIGFTTGIITPLPPEAA